MKVGENQQNTNFLVNKMLLQISFQQFYQIDLLLQDGNHKFNTKYKMQEPEERLERNWKHIYT